MFGETTMGTLAYGSNYGRTQMLPSGQAQVYITDMKGPNELLQYENYGVKPGIVLKNDADWISQVVGAINK